MASQSARQRAIKKAVRLVSGGSAFVRRQSPPFTGTCPVRQHTGDGHYVGRCYHSTYGGKCHLHGDVSRFLVDGADLADADDRKLL